MPTDADFIKLVTGGREVLRLIGAIRGIVDSDPIDIPRLEISLREAIAAVKKTREAIAAGPKRRKTGLDDLLKGFDSYCKMLLAEIVGQQH